MSFNNGKLCLFQLYSDGCTYQNRNNIMSNALLHLAIETKITIYQKFLVRDHTQMECDSVHATIEKKLKNRKIVSPSNYVQISEETRTTPEKYLVKMVNFWFFFSNFNSSQIYSSIRPGKKTSDPNVVDLKRLKYTPKGVIYYKSDFDKDYQLLPQRAKKHVDGNFVFGKKD